MSVTYYATTGGSVARLTDDMITIMSRASAEELATFLTGMVASEGRRAADERSHGDAALAVNIQIGVNTLAASLASLSEAIRRATPPRSNVTRLPASRPRLVEVGR